MKAGQPDMEIERIVAELATRLPFSSPLLMCFYTGLSMPVYSAPMARKPSPNIGMAFSAEIADIISIEAQKNPSIHDGALMIGRIDHNTPYRITGWSYRLFPPPTTLTALPNKGSAFNSCLAMAEHSLVDCLYHVSSAELRRFDKAGSCIISGTK